MPPEAHIFGERKPGLTLDAAVEYVRSFDSGGFGCIWIYHENGTQLAIMVNRNQTYPQYFPSGDHPGWQIAPLSDADWGTEVDFRADNHEPTSMPLAVVVPIDRAVEILQYYWEHGQPADTERWTSLVTGEP